MKGVGIPHLETELLDEARAAVLSDESPLRDDRPKNCEQPRRMSVRRLVVRVCDNLEWVLGSEDSGEEQPIGLWAEHARDQAAERERSSSRRADHVAS